MPFLYLNGTLCCYLLAGTPPVHLIPASSSILSINELGFVFLCLSFFLFFFFCQAGGLWVIQYLKKSKSGFFYEILERSCSARTITAAPSATLKSEKLSLSALSCENHSHVLLIHRLQMHSNGLRNLCLIFSPVF